MWTSYFAKAQEQPNAIGIVRYKPSWFTGENLRHVSPLPHMLHIKSQVEFRRIYIDQVLSAIDPEIFAESYAENILCCFERPEKFCHRFILAEWIELHTGLVVPEWTGDIDEDQPTSRERSRKSSSKSMSQLSLFEK